MHLDASHARTPGRARDLRRRGTILLMVVGVLALLAIVTVVYVTLGRSDRAQSTAVVRAQALGDQAGDIAGYIAGVIGDDLFSTYPERVGVLAGAVGPNGQALRRELWDFPDTDPLMFTVPPRNFNVDRQQDYAFNPQGSAGPVSPNLRAGGIFRRGSDPWLAATEPTRLPVDGRTLPTGEQHWFVQQRDWAHLSNLAPSGNPVNLFNLRDNFDAPPGFSGMSRQLGLIGQNGEMSVATIGQDPDAPIPGVQRLVEGPNGLVFEATARLNRPADWTNNQHLLFRPLLDPVGVAPGDARALANQFADADGDGYIDSRWFELVRFLPRADVANLVTSQPLIPQNADLRLFVAARVIDLSGLVNANTASSFLARPGLVDPTQARPGYALGRSFLGAGVSPGDVDFRRLLTLTDVTRQYGALSGGANGGGYQFFPQPVATTNLTDNYTDYNAARGTIFGDGAFEALRRARERLAIPLQDAALSTPAGAPEAEFAVGERFFNFAISSEDPLGTSQAGSDVRFGGLFGLDDEFELRARSGLNDPSITSRLERVLDGRAGLSPSDRPRGPMRSGRSLAVERAGRELLMPEQPGTTSTGAPWENALFAAINDPRSKMTTISAARTLSQDWSVDPSAPFTSAAGGPSGSTKPPRDLALSMSRLLGEFRPGSRTLVDGVALPGAALTQAQRLFGTYFDGLAPYGSFDTTNNPLAWPALSGTTGAPAASTNADTLNYAGSAELSLRIAAHMTANFIDAVDVDTGAGGALATDFVPTVVSVDFARNQTASPGNNPFERVAPLNPSAERQQQLPPSNGPLTVPPAAGGNTSVDRLVVFGVEPQPILMEVASFKVLTDTPTNDPVGGLQGPNGDDDWGSGPVGSTGTVTIDGDVEVSNPDFLFEIIAFKLHNPSDKTLTLNPGTGAAGTSYYFEYASRFFLLEDAANASTAITIGPGDVKVFYCMNPKTPAEAVARISNATRRATWGSPTSYSTADFQNWITRQFGAGAVRIPLGRPDTMANVDIPATTGSFGSLTQQFADIHGVDASTPLTPAITGLPNTGTWPAATPITRRIVNLWRKTLLGTSETATQNDVLNDYLVDRLRDPENVASYTGSGSSTNQTLYVPTNGSKDVSGSDAGDESGTSAVREDNSGFTLMLYRSIRRPSDSAYFNQPTRSEWTVPPHAIEAKLDRTVTTRISLNGFERAGDWPSGDLQESDWSATLGGRDPVIYDEELGTFLTRGANASVAPYSRSLGVRPETIPTGTITSGSSPLPPPIGDSGSSVTSPTGTSSAKGFTQQLVELRSTDIPGPNDQAMFTRASDMLSPLAVGPSVRPDLLEFARTVPTYTDRMRFLEEAWTTYGEAMALAMDYYSPPPARTPNFEFADVVMHNFARENQVAPTAGPSFPPPPARILPKARNGRIVLDDFAPFLQTGPRPERTFDPASDVSVGPGVPLALALIERFAPSYTLDPAATGVSTPGNDRPSSEFDTRLVPGRININTAPLAVLRLLPMLSPDPGPTGGGTPPAQLTPWMQTDNLVSSASLGLATPAFLDGSTNPTWIYQPDAERYDVAATLLAYRDKTLVFARPPAGGPSGDEVVINMSGAVGRLVDQATNPGVGRPRIDGISSQRGFKTVGEVLAANLRSPDLSFVPDPVSDPEHGLDSSILRFGYDRRKLTTDALDPARRASGSTFGPAAVADGPSEAMAIADAILNTITIRSDTFCVYFKIHGYTRADVKVGGDDNVPMIPSVSKRYVMLVDRSNVTNSLATAPESQRTPRILLLREVAE